MKNILVPCDLCKPADEAFQFAINIAKESSGTVHVLYVIDITPLRDNSARRYSNAFNLNFLKEIEKEAMQKFESMCRRFSADNAKVAIKYAISTLNSEIESYVASNQIDLVVMGTTGEGNGGMVSNTEKIVRQTHVPVLSVRTWS